MASRYTWNTGVPAHSGWYVTRVNKRTPPAWRWFRALQRRGWSSWSFGYSASGRLRVPPMGVGFPHMRPALQESLQIEWATPTEGTPTQPFMRGGTPDSQEPRWYACATLDHRTATIVVLYRWWSGTWWSTACTRFASKYQAERCASIKALYQDNVCFALDPLPLVRG